MSELAAVTEPVPVSRLSATAQARCFACGMDHPHGLRLRFAQERPGCVRADWTPSPAWEGFRGVIHGGIVSTALDEAMSRAVASRGWRALTCSLEVRFREYVAPGETLTVRGWVVERRKRVVKTEAELLCDDGRQKAHAAATFLIVDGCEWR